MKKTKRVRVQSGADVDLEFEVLPSGRHIRFEADDPAALVPGAKLAQVTTVGAEDSPAVGLQTPADAQALVDREAARFAELVDSRRRVAALLSGVN